MEQKIIKEENDKELNCADTPCNMRTRSSKAPVRDRCKTPDSLETSKIIQVPQLSPNQSSSPRQSANENSSPLNNGSVGSLTPPLPVSVALSVSLDGNQTQQYSQGSYASCITRPLVKVKRFLSTLVQFGNDISADVGDRVRSLVLNLVSSNLSIEEFHHALQDVTNFPLRPFVLPFLRTHLPILQREIHALARVNKQSTLQYTRTHEHLILDSAHSPSEPSEIFLSNEAQVTTGIKRRASDSIYENGINGQSHQESQDYIPLKRSLNSQNAFLLSHQSLLLPNITTTVPNAHIFDYSQHNSVHRVEENLNSDNNRSNNRGDDEWRNIHVMLNCILSMVEKTKRALTILQQRNNQDLTNEWLRKQDVSVDLKKAANEIMLQAVRQTEDRVAEVRRKAEDAVNDVKRQAVIELQKAVAAAEIKANELVAAERAKMEKLLLEAKRHSEENSSNIESADNSLSPVAPAVQTTGSQQNSCWNCGRKAHETCSGCSIARYCGPFCQHKDWENHHQICSKDKSRPLRSSTPSTTVAPHVNLSDVQFTK